jgi:hypothetical protein
MRAAGVLLTGMLVVGAVATPIGASGILPPDNPIANLAPAPNFLSSGICHETSVATPCTNPCVRTVGQGANRRAVFPSFSGTPTCTQFVLRALNSARSDEDLPAIVLPTNWFQLNPQEQIFVSTVATGYTTLEADYAWMYEDGWGGSPSSTSNVACTFAGALGCWGHRDELLGFDGTYNFGVGLHCTTCEMGTGFAIVNGTGSFTSLIELPAGNPPPMYFTWAKNVVPYLAASQSPT